MKLYSSRIESPFIEIFFIWGDGKLYVDVIGSLWQTLHLFTFGKHFQLNNFYESIENDRNILEIFLGKIVPY